MMKMVIYSIVVSILYLVVMNVVNKKMESLDFSNNSILETSTQTSYLTVTITGAVNNPGTYTASRGEKLSYLITLAGGLKDNADNKTYNLSTLLIDNTSYYIPSINSEVEKVSINNATIAQLDALPGIGSVLAKRIVSYRSSHGVFNQIEDITNVDGIGKVLFEEIKDLICL